MVWFYYISNIWKNQVFLKNRSPDFLLSPFFAQCECAVTRGTAAAKGKRAAAQECGMWNVEFGMCGSLCKSKNRFAVRFPRARAQDILSFLHSFILYKCARVVHLLCKSCASVVHAGGKKRRSAQYFRGFPVVQLLCSFARNSEFRIKKASPRREGRDALLRKRRTPL